MASITITRDTGSTVFKTMEPDGSTVQKSWNVNTSTPIVDNVIGELKCLEMQFSITGDYLGSDLNNKNICFTPALFNYLAVSFLTNWKSPNRFEFLITDYTDTTEYDMVLLCQAGYDIEVMKNYRCTIQTVDENDFIIRFYFYQGQDDHAWMSPVGKDNHFKLLRSSQYDVVDLPVTPYTSSVYNATSQRLGYYLFIEDITDAMNTKGYLTEAFKYQAGWFAMEQQLGSPYFTNPVFEIFRDSLPVTGLSPAFPTQVRFTVTAPNEFSSVTETYLWMVRVTSFDNSVDFIENYNGSFAKITTDAGTGLINNALIKPSTGPTNSTGDDWYIDCFIDPTKLVFGESYRFIGIAYLKSGDTYEVNSFHSAGFRVDSYPGFNGGGFDITGTIKDYNQEFTGNELICVIEERLQSKLVIDFPSDQYKDDIFVRLGLTITNDIRRYMTSIIMEIYEETTSGPDTTKQIFDRKIFLKTSPTAYTSNSGATLTFGTDQAIFTNDLRVRFESDIPNLETQVNGIVLTSPTSNMNWAGRTVRIEWKMVFYYDDYTTPFEESVRFIQKIKPKSYETGSKLTIVDPRSKLTPIVFCSDEETCFETTLNVSGAEGDETEYRLMTTIEKTTENSTQLEENEEWVGDELPQLNSDKFINQESAFGETETDKALFCINPTELIYGVPYKVSAIAKRIIPEFISPIAKQYYDALFAANGDVDIDSESLYGIDLETFKSALDEMFVSIDTAGLTSKILRFTPRLGSTNATVCINAMNPGTFDGVFPNGVTIDINGISFNGVDQIEQTGFLQSDFPSLNSVGISFKNVVSAADGKYALGSHDGGTLTSIFTAFGNKYYYNMNSASWIINEIRNDNEFIHISRINSAIELYIDGLAIESGTLSSSALHSNYEIYIGGVNNEGVASNFSAITIRNECFGNGLSLSEQYNLFNILQTFDTTLGR